MWEELLAAYISPLWLITCCICPGPRLALICIQTASLGYPLSTENEILLYKERHSLLLECLITILICMRKVWGATGSIYQPLTYGSYCAISANIDFKIAHKISDLGCALSMVNGMMCCNERHTLLLKYVITFLRYIRMVRRELLAASKSTLWSTWCQFCQK